MTNAKQYYNKKMTNSKQYYNKKWLILSNIIIRNSPMQEYQKRISLKSK